MTKVPDNSLAFLDAYTGAFPPDLPLLREKLLIAAEKVTKKHGIELASLLTEIPDVPDSHLVEADGSPAKTISLRLGERTAESKCIIIGARHGTERVGPWAFINFLNQIVDGKFPEVVTALKEGGTQLFFTLGNPRGFMEQSRSVAIVEDGKVRLVDPGRPSVLPLSQELLDKPESFAVQKIRAIHEELQNTPLPNWSAAFLQKFWTDTQAQDAELHDKMIMELPAGTVHAGLPFGIEHHGIGTMTPYILMAVAAYELCGTRPTDEVLGQQNFMNVDPSKVTPTNKMTYVSIHSGLGDKGKILYIAEALGVTPDEAKANIKAIFGDTGPVIAFTQQGAIYAMQFRETLAAAAMLGGGISPQNITCVAPEIGVVSGQNPAIASTYKELEVPVHSERIQRAHLTTLQDGRLGWGPEGNRFAQEAGYTLNPDNPTVDPWFTGDMAKGKIPEMMASAVVGRPCPRTASSTTPAPSVG